MLERVLDGFNHLVRRYLKFNLEDKIVPARVSNDRNLNNERVWKFYYRRKFKN